MAIIETDAHYRDTLRRIAAVEGLITRLRSIQAEAISERALGRLLDEDVREVCEAGALGDAIANLKYTIGQLKTDAADWEAFIAYGSRSAGNATGSAA